MSDTSSSASNAAAPAPPGRGLPRFAGYEVEAVLGAGGMGKVYRARQLGLSRLVALKVLRDGADAGPEERARFRREAEAMARLKHANVAAIYEVGEGEDGPFFAMELVEGGCLADRLGRKPRFDYRAAAAEVETLARAVHHAHEQGVLHRDLKPGNVLLTADGVLKITDFGLAKCLDDKGARTQTGAILGTPGYMAPEQVLGVTRKIGPAVDVYALGAVLYEMLTGRPPFQAENTADVVLQTLSDEPVPPTRLQPKLPRDLETICLKCLRKDPKKRYAGAPALADDLRRFQEGRPILARPAGAVERVARWAWRRPAAAGLIAVSVAAVLALSLGGWWTSVRLGYESEQTGKARNRAEANFQKTLEVAGDLSDELVAAVKPIAGTRSKTIARILERGRKVYDDLMGQDPTPAVRAAKGRMLNAFADVYLEMNDSAAALDSATQARDLFDGLVREHAGEDAYLGGRGLSEANLGRTLVERGDLATALESLRASLKDRQAVYDHNPDDPKRQYDLALSHGWVGNVVFNQGDYAAAKASYDTAFDLRERAASLRPDDPDYQLALGLGHEKKGDFLFDTDAAASRREYEAARNVYRRLVEKDADNAEWRQTLVRATSSIAQTYQNENDVRQAVTEFESAAHIAEEFSRRDPDDVNWQRELLRCRLHIARLPLWDGVREGAPRPAEEDAASLARRLRRQLDIFEELGALSRGRMEQDPGNAHWRKDFAMMHTQQGGLHINLGLRAAEPKEKEDHLAQAEKSLETALGYWKELARQDPTNVELPENLTETLTLQGQLWTIRNEVGKAQAANEDAHETALAADERLIALFPDSEVWRTQAVSDCTGLLQAVALEEVDADARTRSQVERAVALLRNVKMRGQWKMEEEKLLQDLEAARSRLAAPPAKASSGQ